MSPNCANTPTLYIIIIINCISCRFLEFKKTYFTYTLVSSNKCEAVSQFTSREYLGKIFMTYKYGLKGLLTKKHLEIPRYFNGTSFATCFA